MHALEPIVRRLLSQMGSTPEEIATFLQAKRVVGVRMSAFYCPVARYVQRTLGISGEYDAATFPIARTFVVKGMSVPLPEPVANFRARFDAGAFPGLAIEHVGLG